MADPLSILNSARLASLDYVAKAGKGPLLALLKRAQAELDKSLAAVEGGDEAFGPTQLHATLAQVTAIASLVKKGLAGQVIEAGRFSAKTAVGASLKYLGAAEKRYAGVGTSPLGLRTALVFERAGGRTETSILRRILSNPNEPGHRGVLDRYGDAVVAKFEEKLQTRMITGAPWSKVRSELVAESPFLQAQPAHWAERILRTETMAAHNRAGYEATQEIDAQVGGGMIRILSATFDDRTGSDSYAVHGQIRGMNEPFESWFGKYMTPPNRPNDREIIVPHHMDWDIPSELHPKSDGDVAKRWREEKRKGAPPPRPRLSTIELSEIGEAAAARRAGEKAPGQAPEVPPPVSPEVPPVAPPEDLPPQSPDAPPPVGGELSAGEIEGGREVSPVESEMLDSLGETNGALDGSPYYGVPLTEKAPLRSVIGEIFHPADLDLAMATLDELLATASSIESLGARHGVSLPSDSPIRRADVQRELQTDGKDRYPGGLQIAPGRVVLVSSPERYTSQQVRERCISLGRRYENVTIKVPVRIVTRDELVEAVQKKLGKSRVVDVNLSPEKYAEHATAIAKSGVVGKETTEAFNSLLRDHGYAQDPLRSRGEIALMSAKDQRKYKRMAAFADWDGNISIGRDSALAFKWAQDSIRKGEPVTRTSATTGIQTYVHEAVHTYSPAGKGAYSARGAVVEELCTESLSRSITAKLVGAPSSVASQYGNGYSEMLDQLLPHVAKATGDSGSHEELRDLGFQKVVGAADRLWKAKRQFNDSEEYTAAFLDELSVTDTEKRNELRKQISIASRHLI